MGVFEVMREAFRKQDENIAAQTIRLLAEQTLKFALSRLQGERPTGERRHSHIFTALSAACDMGLRCGISRRQVDEFHEELWAVIDLPNGSIAFSIDEYNGEGYLVGDEATRERIRAHLSLPPG